MSTPPTEEHGRDGFCERLQRGNDAWASAYRRPEVNGSAKAVVLTCMDSRIPPLEMLGLAPGEAFIIRNAGNSVTDDALRSLIVCLTAMECRKVLVVGHTCCGMRCPGDLDRRVSEAVDVEGLSAGLGRSIEDLGDWLGFHHVPEWEWAERQADRLRDLLPRILPGLPVRVFTALYDLDSGRVRFAQPSQKRNMRA
ncbi:MAG: hypothetical protein GXY70_02010 [Euryarchaeota archaeon]|nr:hypothetical protein [Euryarchaeota archaeon]